MRMRAIHIILVLLLASAALAKGTKVYRSEVLLVPGTNLQQQVDTAGMNVVLACAAGETYTAAEIRLQRGQVLKGNASVWTGVVRPGVNCRVEGVRFSGAQSRVILSNCWCVTVRDCVFGTSQVAVAIVGFDSVVDVLVERCRFDLGQYGVLIEGGAHISIRVRDCSFEGYPFGVAIRGYTIGASVTGCHFESIRAADIVVDHDNATSTILSGNVHIRPVVPVLLVRGNGCSVRDAVIRGPAAPKVEKTFIRAVIQ